MAPVKVIIAETGCYERLKTGALTYVEMEKTTMWNQALAYNL